MKYKKSQDFLNVVKSKNPNEKEFHQVAGDILVSCLEKGLKEDNEFEIIYRDNDSRSLDDQRGIHTESITLSED